MSSSQVSVVIPTWNGAHLLDVVMNSLRRQTFDSFEVIIVDNGSSDATADLVRKTWPDATLIELGHNQGFSAAVNAGVAHSRAAAVALVNNDVELDPNWLRWTFSTLAQRPELGAVTGKLLDFTNRSLIQELGTDFAWDGDPLQVARGDLDEGQFETPGEVLSVCAGASLYRRSALDDVGEFDERFFAYLEDLDWGLRAQLRGWRAWYDPRARAFHIGGATAKSTSLSVLKLYTRNSWILLAKDFPREVFIKYGPYLVYQQVRLALGAIRNRSFRIYMGSLIEFLRLLPGIMRDRRTIQRRATHKERVLSTIRLHAT